MSAILKTSEKPPLSATEWIVGNAYLRITSGSPVSTRVIRKQSLLLESEAVWTGFAETAGLLTPCCESRLN